MSHVSHLLRAMIDATGWSQKRIADFAGVSQARLNRWLHDKDQPSGQNLVAVLVAADKLVYDVGLSKEGQTRLAAALSQVPARIGKSAPSLRESIYPANSLMTEIDFSQPPDAQSSDGVSVIPSFPRRAIPQVKARDAMSDEERSAASFSYRKGDDVFHSKDALESDFWLFPQSFVAKITARADAALLMVCATTDDMAPTVQRGDVAVLDTSCKEPRMNGVYAIRNRWGDVVLHRIRPSADDDLVRLMSDNAVDGGSPVERRPDDLDIVGKMVAIVRPAG